MIGSGELPGALPPGHLPGLCLEPTGGLKVPPDPQLQVEMTVGHCMLCLRHNIHTSSDLQTIDSEKNKSILMGKLVEKWVEIIKN